MKINKWNQVWLTALVAFGCLRLECAKVSAQNDDAVVAQNGTATLDVTNAPAEPSATEADTSQKEDARWKRRSDFLDSFNNSSTARNRNAVVSIGKNAILKTNETAEAVVAVGGSATSAGVVRDAVVAVGGSATVSGKVHDAVVAVGGDVTIDGAEVGDAAVAVLGNVKVEKGSIIHGDVVSVGGKVDVAEGATVDGKITEVDTGSFGLPDLKWLRHWIVDCAFKLRPLAPTARIGWAWAVTGAFLLLYLLVAVALPGLVKNCVSELTRRPATTFLMGLLAKILGPLIFLILAATGVGVIVIPFLVAAMLFGALIGKVAFIEYLGQSLGRLFGMSTLVKPVLALLLGSVVITLLYFVPVLGLVVLSVTGLWGFGAAVTAAFGSLRREMPERPASPPPTMSGPTPGNAAAFTAGLAAMASEQTQTTTPGSAPAPMPVPPSNPAVNASEALSLPRANFWERVGAMFLDVILVSILGSLVGPFTPFVALAYFAGMWAWRGTTIGGLVLNLKVVRLDNQPVTFAVALVRGLASVFSVIVFFLGFLWMIWDRDKQTWHDKIAGTVVVRVPRAMPLVCM